MLVVVNPKSPNFGTSVLHIFSPRLRHLKPVAPARPHCAQLPNAPLLESKDPRVLELRYFRDFGVWAKKGGFLKGFSNLPKFAQNLTNPAVHQYCVNFGYKGFPGGFWALAPTFQAITLERRGRFCSSLDMLCPTPLGTTLQSYKALL